MSRVNKYWLVGMQILALLLIAGCGGQATPLEKSSSSNQNYLPLLFDNYGRSVQVEQKPTRVLTLGPHVTELMIALGLSDMIIGNSLDNHSRGPLPQYADEYAKIPELTYGSATREAVLSSGADFIYGIDWEFGEEGLDIDELQSFGITAYMNKASTLDEIYKEISEIGQIFQVETAAYTFIENQKKRIADINEKVKGYGPLRVLVYDSGGDGVFTAGGSNFESQLIEKAGGVNIFADIVDKQWTTVSYEEILARQPEVIIVHDYDETSIEQKIDNIKSDPALSTLESVQQERFVIVSLEGVLPGNRMAYTVETLAQGFYPHVFE